MEYYKPALIDSFKELAATGRVEFVAETYAHSVASLYDPVEFRNQVRMQQTKLRELFGIERSRVFCNSELIYSDEIASEVVIGVVVGVADVEEAIATQSIGLMYLEAEAYLFHNG